MNLEQIRLKFNQASGLRLSGHNLQPGLASGNLGTAASPDSTGVQKRIVLRNCGLIDPEQLGDYISAAEGYIGLDKALRLTPDEVTRQVAASGLKGRGGAGFATAEKWLKCRTAAGAEKFYICNALDSDPLAQTSRLLMESDPHFVLEGLLIGAYAAGASHSYLCLAAGNPLALKRLNIALEQMQANNLLGEFILESGFTASIEIKEVPPGLVSGEETALLRFLASKQAMPYLRPPYPAVQGLDGKPTVINNAETLANVALILQKGPEWFARQGTPASHGTKIVTLCGDITHRLTLEVLLGTTLRDIIEKAGGGAAEGKNIKAVQLGGPSGTFFTNDEMDLPLDYESLQKAGAIMGSGTIEVFTDAFCAVQVARAKMTYLHEQSCGKCVFCREGSYQMSEILDDLAAGRSKKQDLDLLAEIGEAMQQGSICGLGRSAPAPILSTLKKFREDYAAHLKGENGHGGCKAINSNPV